MSARPTAPLTYREAWRRFTRNARLYLIYVTMSEVNNTIYLIGFALYLAEVFSAGGPVHLPGLSLDPLVYVGVVLGAEGLAHGLNSIPAGFLGDRFGRRKSFVTASLVGVAAAALTLFTRDPLLLLVLSVVNGVGNSFHGVVSGPFLMESSGEVERTHLFTLSNVLNTVSDVFGAVAALGFVLFFRGWTAGIDPSILGPLAFPPLSALPLRLTLFVAAPFGVLELVPIFFMKESYAPSPTPLRDVFLMRRVENKRTIGELFGVTALYSLGLGLFFPLLAVYLDRSFGADEVSYSPLVALDSLVVAVAALAVPLVVRRLGKVRSVVAVRLSSVPILLAMGLVPGVVPAGFAFAAFAALFIGRDAVANLAGPAASQFTMEAVRPDERATAAGFTHFAWDVVYGIGAFAGGFLLAAGGYWLAFVLAAFLSTAHGVLWHAFFGHHPVELASRTVTASDGGNV